jgi:muramoyltetrapeptide carboxypeptidase
LELGLSILKARGFDVVIHPQTYLGADTGNQLAGTPEEKALAFMDLWNNDSVSVIMASCGGNFSSQFLNLLDYEELSLTPKAVIGFSDTTALLSALYACAGIGGIFGPTVQTLGRIENLDKVTDILFGRTVSEIELTGSTLLPSSINNSAKAPLYAATLAVLLSLAGTPYFPDLSGHILVIEDIGEELSHLDRMLWQLNQLCPFSHLEGLIFGEFVDMSDTGRPLGLDFEGVVRKHTAGLLIPILINAPIGHGSNFMPIQLGRTATLDASSSPRLIL